MHALAAAVLLSCSCVLAPYYAQAQELEVPAEGAQEGKTVAEHKENLLEVRLPNAKGEKQSFAILDIYDNTNDPEGYWQPTGAEDGDTEEGSSKLEVAHYRDLLPGEKAAIADSMQYLSDMLGFAEKENLPLIKLQLFPDKDDNASAMSSTAIFKDNEGKLTHYITGTMLAESIQAKDKLSAISTDDKYVADIIIDDASEKWYMDKFPILPSNGTASDYFGTVTHEMFHALGLAANTANWSSDEEPDIRIGTSAMDGEGINTVFNKYEIGLRDVFGRVVYYYANNADERQYADENPLEADDEMKIPAGYKLVSRSLQYITLEEYNNLSKEQLDPDKFYILRNSVKQSAPDEGQTDGDEDEECLKAANKPLTGFVNSQGGVYFTGKNVRDVLTTDGELAELAVADATNNYTVKGGLLINCYEDSEIDAAPELSHIELQNSLMSHQNYRNWCTFMEAELALLQDLGYDIDRSKYFGKSVYNSGTEKDRFSFVNTNGFNSSQRHGIGLHIYGSYVDVKQQADLNAAGNYSMGIRVDGVANKLDINSYVSANGEGSNALAVTYGKEHEVTLQKKAALVAMGADGVAARFDFGSNELGDMAEYRGSGIDAIYRSEEEVEYFKNINPDYEGEAGWIATDIVPDAINGALATDFNVNGTLAGKQAAIYISPNAYVENINIMNGASIVGDIISEWNPEEILYQNRNEAGGIEGNVLKTTLGENSLTQLSFGAKADTDGAVIRENGELLADKDFQLNYAGNIKGSKSLVMNVVGGKLAFNGAADVKSVEIAQDAVLQGNGEYKVAAADAGYGFVNKGTLAPGNNGLGTLNIAGSFNNEGTIAAEFMGDGTSDKIIVDGDALINGRLELTALESYFGTTTAIQIVENKSGDNSRVIDNITDENITINAVSPILKMKLVQNDEHTGFVISTEREENAYKNCADDELTRSLAAAFDKNAAHAEGDAQKLVAAVDFAGDKSAFNSAMRKLNPAVYSSSAQATLDTHTMLNNLNMLGSFSVHEKPEALRAGGGRGAASVSEPQRNSWRNIVMPFSSYTDQHNGSSAYTNHNSGMLGAMERTLDNGLTLGYHAALNHQSTSAAGGSVKGEGLYLGTQASYAPDMWKGWSLFGSARLGVEQMRSHRQVAFGSYHGSADADWTGYSGSLRLGTALTKTAGVVKSGPFAAMDYSFVHRPEVIEEGGAVCTHLESATYDSLRTQLGYQLSTAPKLLSSYDSTEWQAHFSAAWNHELLGDNGATSYTLADLPGVTINDTAKNYGRDSLGLLAGVTFRTPKNLDVTVNLGSDIYRKGGSAVYGKVGLEWKF